MALKLGKTPEEILAEKLKCAAKVTLILIGQVVILAALLHAAEESKGAALVGSILLCFGAWQLVSRVVTGENFALRIVLKVTNSRELFDDVFTALLVLNTAIFVYAVLGRWTSTLGP